MAVVAGFLPEEDAGYANWGYIWRQTQWKHHFVVICPGKLQVFASEQRTKLKRVVLLNDCTVSIIEAAGSLQETSRLGKKSARNQNLPEPEGVIVAVKFSKKTKQLFILVSNQDEASFWKTRIEQAATSPSPQGKKMARKLFRLFSSHIVSSNKQNTNTSRSLPFRWQGESTSTNTKALENVVHTVELDSLSKCTDFLRLSCSRERMHAFEVSRTMIDHFNSSYQLGDYTLPNELRVEAWKGTLSNIVKTLRNGILADDPVIHNPDELLLACEAWVMSAVHDKIMGACKQMFSDKDKQLSIILSKLSQVDPLLLGVRKEFQDNVLGEAVHVFGMMNSHRTPLEKAVCVRRTVNCVMEGIHSCKRDAEGSLPCTDDLLSFMLLLMAHTKVRHLAANACFMQNFFCLQEEDGHKGELGYHITNFVAACDYLSSPEIANLVSSGASSPAFSNPSSSFSSSGSPSSSQTSQTSICSK